MGLICVIDNVPCRSIIALPDGPLKFGAAAYRRFIAWGSRRSLHLPSGMVRRSTSTDELTSALEKHRECLNMALPARSGGSLKCKNLSHQVRQTGCKCSIGESTSYRDRTPLIALARATLVTCPSASADKRPRMRSLSSPTSLGCMALMV